MGFRDVIEYTRSLRLQITQPVSSAQRREDIAWSASRLLMATRLTSGPGDLVEEVLEAMAHGKPDRAVERLVQERPTHAHSPMYWALSCHVAAQTASEFPSEITRDTSQELPRSPSDWLGEFRRRLEAVADPMDDGTTILHQISIAHCILFRDRAGMDWGVDRLLGSLSPDVLQSSELSRDTAAFLGGLLTQREDVPKRRRLIELLNQASEQPEAKEIGAALRKLIVPGDDMPEVDKRAFKKKPSGDKKRGFAARIDNLAENYGWLFWPAVIGGVLLICLLAVGAVFEFILDTSPIGHQSVSDWYKHNEDAKKLAEVRDEPPPDEFIPDPALPPDFAPTASSSPTRSQDALAHGLAERIRQDGARIAARAGIPRAVRSRDGATVFHAELTGVSHQLLPEVGFIRALVKYHIEWYRDGEATGAQWLEARYEYAGDQWHSVSIVRGLNETNRAGQQLYALAPAEMDWAASLLLAP